MKVTMGTNKEKSSINTLLVDPDFFHIFSFKLLEGNKSNVLTTKNSAVITWSLAQKMFPGEDPIGKTLSFENEQNSVIITGIMEDLVQNTQIPEGEIVVNYEMLDAIWPDEINKWYSVGFAMYFLAKENTNLPSKASIVVDLFYKNEYTDYTWSNRKEVFFILLT